MISALKYDSGNVGCWLEKSLGGKIVNEWYNGDREIETIEIGSLNN